MGKGHTTGCEDHENAEHALNIRVAIEIARRCYLAQNQGADCCDDPLGRQEPGVARAGAHDWLGNERNRVIVELKEAPFGASSASSSSAAACSAFPVLPSPVSPASAPAPGAEESQQASNPALVRQLQAFATLKREGALTAEEFEAAKKRVLGL